MLKSHLGRRVSLIAFFGAVLLFRPAVGQAAPTVSVAVNGAGYMNMNLPNGKLAPGVLFDVFGSGLGPASIVHGTPYPFTTSVAGTSIKVTVGAVSVDCWIVFSLNTQVAAILPDNIPSGNGTLVLTFNGQASAPLNITVFSNDFGIFTVNQQGWGQAVMTSPFSPFTANGNGTGLAANKPGDLLDIWGTGLGSCLGFGFPCDEINGPAPGNMPLNVQVFVGLTQAQVQYIGRSGCCSGIDQIRIVVPNNQFGCEIPIYVVVNGLASNFAWLAITPSGTKCQDANLTGLTPDQINTIIGKGSFTAGGLSVMRTLADGGGITTPFNSGTVGAQFYKYSNPVTFFTASAVIPTAGLCNVTFFPVSVPTSGFQGLNASNTLSATTPMGTYIAPLVQPGGYAVAFEPGVPSSTGIIGDGTLPQPGQYTITGTGGPDVPAFSTSINYRPQGGVFQWTNRTSITTVNRSQPLTVTWSGGTPGALAYVHGRAYATMDQGTGTDFTCWEDATKGTFTVPASILSLMPVGITISGRATGVLDVTENYQGPMLNIPNVDYSSFSFTDGELKSRIQYQ